MVRPRFDSDERWNESRRIGPRPGSYYLTHHSISHHRKTVDIYADNDLYATWHRVLQLASEKGAAQTDDRLEITMTDVMQVTKRSRGVPALSLLRALCGHAQWQWSEPTWARSGWIVVRNLARKQGITPRKPRSATPDYAASASASATTTPIAPENGGGAPAPRRRPERGRLSERANSLYAAWTADSRQRFDRFWAAYAHKVARAAAIESWNHLGPPSEIEAEKIIRAALCQRQEWNRKRVPVDKTPHPATWLNSGRWEDELPSPESITAQNQPRLVL